MAKEVGININIKGTKDVIDLQKQIRQVNKQLKETEDAEAFDKLAADLVKLKAQLREARKEQRQAVDAFAATDKGIGAYSRLSAQLRVARNNLKDLQASGTATGAEIEKLTKEINELDTTLKDIDRSVGQTNREVGNYEEAVRKAIGVTDAQTGAYSRLEARLKIVKKAYNDVAVTEGKASKQAKELRQEITKLEKQLDKTGKSAQAGGKRIGGLRTQLRGLGPGVAGLASSFLVFSELPAVLGDAIEGARMLGAMFSATEARTQAFSKAVQEGAQELFNEQAALGAAFNALRQTEEGTQARTDAIERLNSEYPEYVGNLTEEQISLVGIDEIQRQATDALIENTVQRQKSAIIQNTLNKLASDYAERITIAAEANTGLGKTIDATSTIASGGLGFLIEQFTGVEASVSGVTAAFNEAEIAGSKALLGQTDKLDDQLRDAYAELSGLFEEQAAEAEKLAAERQAKLEAEQEKKAQERAKKRAEAAAKRIAEQLARERNQILKEEERTGKAQLQLLQRLEEQIIKAQFDAREEGLQKALDQENQASQKRVDQFKANSTKFENEAKQRQEKINKAFGEGSEQALRLQGQIADQRIKLTEQTDKAIEAERAASLQRIADIRKTFADKEAQEAQQELQKRLSELQTERQAIAAAVDQELLIIREKRAKGNIDAIEADKQAFSARIKAIRDQLAQLDREEIDLEQLGFSGDEAIQEASAKIVAQRQQLNTQLAELEEQQTAKVLEEQRKRGDAIAEGFKMGFNAVKESLSLIDNFASALNERENQRLEGLANERTANIEALQAELSEASGLEKAFIEQRIQEETKAAEEIAAAQERARKEQAIAQKAIAIGQAIINGALAVTAVLAQTTDPTPVQAFRFAAVAATIATTAAQVATIAAQPLATGGIVGFDGGGKVNQSQNIPTQSNGDNVLATLKRGEVVLNQRQQSLLGGSQTFRNIGVPGFQGGGVVSPPIGAPSLAQSVSDSNNVQALIETNSRLIASVNSRIDRISVEYTTETGDAIERDNRDRKQITTRATL